jgi:hypothetical protein
LPAANQHGRLRSDAREKLAEFASGVSAAQHDRRFRSALELEHAVAIDEAGFRQTRQRARRDDAAGRDDESLGFEDDVVADRQLGRRQKARRSQVERELFDPGDAVVGEILYERALTRGDERHVGGRGRDPNAERAGVARVLKCVARRQQRFAGHTPAQYAQSAQRAGVYQRDVAAEIAHRPRRRIPSRTSADDYEFVRVPDHRQGTYRPCGRAPSR